MMTVSTKVSDLSNENKLVFDFKMQDDETNSNLNCKIEFNSKSEETDLTLLKRFADYFKNYVDNFDIEPPLCELLDEFIDDNDII